MKTIILAIVFLTSIQIAHAQTELNWNQIETTKFGEQVSFKLVHNYDPNNPDKKNSLLNGQYKIGDNYGSYTLATFDNGKAIGTWNKYNASGKLETISNYKDGKIDGEYVDYFITGKISNKSFYKNGKEEGKWLTFDKDGKKISETNYKNGKKEGVQEGKAYISGYDKCTYVNHYKNDKPLGSWKTTCRNRVIIDREYKSEEDYTEKVFFKNGQLKLLKSKKDGKKDGWQKEYDIDGVLLNDYQYQEGILIVRKEYYETGKPKLVVHRNLNDEKHGEYIEYSETNKLVKKGNYSNGYKDGIWNYYYENGELSVQYTYKNGKRTGKYTAYHQGNIVNEKGEYFKNKKVGVWKAYSIIGKLTTETTYENGKKVSVKKIID